MSCRQACRVHCPPSAGVAQGPKKKCSRLRRRRPLSEGPSQHQPLTFPLIPTPTTPLEFEPIPDDGQFLDFQGDLPFGEVSPEEIPPPIVSPERLPLPPSPPTQTLTGQPRQTTPAAKPRRSQRPIRSRIDPSVDDNVDKYNKKAKKRSRTRRNIHAPCERRYNDLLIRLEAHLNVCRVGLGERSGVSFSNKRKEVNQPILAALNDKRPGSEEEEDEESKEEKNPAKRGRKPAAAKNGSDSGSEDEFEPAPKKGRKAAAKPKKAAGGGDGRKPGTGYTKECKLSAELAAVVGQPRLAHHEVVKQIWKLVKEKNLYDPKNKKFAICNDELLPVIGVKRFRTLGMMKYLKNHFLAD